jgi:hypothetical protein
MSLLETLLDAGDGAVVREIAQGLGLCEDDARDAVRRLAPALSRGISRNARKPGGLEALMAALGSGNHQRYVDRPELLTEQDTVADGNAILGHVFGSKDVSRNVAGHVARETGLDSGLLKKMLPMLAAAAMGALGRQTSGEGALSRLNERTGTDPGLVGMLETFLDADRDGAVVDDVLSLARKLF